MKQKKIYTEEEYDSLLAYIITQLKRYGMKATTMDSIANELHISKRTLYELFHSKENMFLKALEYHCKKMGEIRKEIFETSSNVMEAILKCFVHNRDVMSDISVEFLRDINEYYTLRYLKKDVQKEESRTNHYMLLYDVMSKGVQEGYFRKDINLSVHCRMFIIQMESLKRMEELFPKDISLLEVYDSIIIGFLRALSTNEGYRELERFIPLLQSSKAIQSN